jgi:hypothetical protein
MGIRALAWLLRPPLVVAGGVLTGWYFLAQEFR